MNDPHVVSLRYRLADVSSRQYVSPAIFECETDAFFLYLASGVLTTRMKGHHSTVESARAVVEPYLRAWEISAGLRCGPNAFLLLFDPPAEIVDRNPTPKQEDGVYTAVANLVVGAATLKATAILVQREYPSPPKCFAATPDVQTMWFRYGLYYEGKEPLLSMAYACLTLLEGSTGAASGFRTAVCKKYFIDQAVRDKLGDIVSERGDPTEARKLGNAATMTPLTKQEKQWVEDVIKAFIRRKAEYDADSTSPLVQITMADFIPLGDAGKS